MIQPADPKIIYVPTYNPQVVYVTPPPPPPVAGPTTGDVVAAGLIGFTAGVIVGSMFNNRNYYPYPNWGYGGVWYGGHPYSRNVYVYAPNYNRGYPPGYRPGYGYRPPPSYPNRWNRASTLPAYNNSNYYNRFNGNQNQRPGNSAPPLVGNNVSNRPGAYRPPNNRTGNTTGSGNINKSGNNVTINNNTNGNKRPATGGGTASPAWKGQQQYQGARPGGSGSGSQPPRNANMPARPSTPAPGAATRPTTPAARPGATASGRPASDRGFGGASTGAQPNRGAAPARPASPAGRPATSPAPASGNNRQTAFTGAAGGAGTGTQTDRAAANRGQSSVGKGGTRSAPANRQRGGRQ